MGNVASLFPGELRESTIYPEEPLPEASHVLVSSWLINILLTVVHIARPSAMLLNKGFNVCILLFLAMKFTDHLTIGMFIRTSWKKKGKALT